MHERDAIFQLWKHSEKSGLKSALATVVEVKGSAYRRPGARMLLTLDGRSAGVISGGCLDADLHARAQMVMESGVAQLACYDTTSSQDIVFGLGLESLAGGLSRQDVCQAFGIHRTTLRKWQLRQEKDCLSDQPRSGSPSKIKRQDGSALLSQLQAMPDATLEEHLVRWHREQGRLMTMARAIVRLNWTRKKSVKAQGQARQAWITGAKEWDLQREEILHQLGTLSRGDVG